MTDRTQSDAMFNNLMDLACSAPCTVSRMACRAGCPVGRFMYSRRSRVLIASVLPVYG